MKRLISVMSLLVLMMMLNGCSGKSELPLNVSKEGISPYELTENEKYILQSFNMYGNSQLITFNAPKEAIAMNVNVYRLDESGNWRLTGGGGVSIGNDKEPMDSLAGLFTMQLKENYAIDLVINTGGLASYKTDEIFLDNEAMVSMKVFLQEHQDITLNSEIPVALMVYDSGGSMKNYALQDYFEPSKFEGMDLVQVVTLTFSDK